MPNVCGQTRLRGLYQAFVLPATAARAARKLTKPMARILNTGGNLPMGTDGTLSVYPFWGSFKRYAQNLPARALSQGPVALWGLALAFLAAGLLSVAALSGYGLPSWWVLLGLAA